MSEQILSAVHGVTTMLFGIYCSAFFLGIKPIRKNILKILHIMVFRDEYIEYNNV
jgi:hypothetical protein